MEVTFYGVRGSTPCSCPGTAGIGGNTSCVLVSAAGAAPILLDLGTGLRFFGIDWVREHPTTPFTGLALVSHLHWDHVQGIPFFAPVLAADSQLTVVAPPQESNSNLAEVFDAFLQPPMFPVKLADLPGNISFETRSCGSFAHGPLTVTVAAVQHNGATNGYRIDENATGKSVAYVSDHQQPCGDLTYIDPAVRQLCHGVDVLIHDAQYDDAEFASKETWGHSTVRYAVEVARQTGAKELYLFHHDPSHNDQWVADAVADANELAGGQFVVRAATEGRTVTL